VILKEYNTVTFRWPKCRRYNRSIVSHIAVEVEKRITVLQWTKSVWREDFW